MRVAGSGTTTVGAGSGNEGNKAIKDGGIIRDLFPGTNSPGQASVEHARGLSGSRTRLQWSTHRASDQDSVVWVGVVCSSCPPGLVPSQRLLSSMLLYPHIGHLVIEKILY